MPISSKVTGVNSGINWFGSHNAFYSFSIYKKEKMQYLQTPRNQSVRNKV